MGRKRRTCPGNGGGNGGRVDLQADPSGGRFATEHSGQAGRKSRPEEHLLNRMMLSQILDGLDKEERQLIYLRYFQEKTQAAVGEILGISQVQVSRMERKYWSG